jgi:hypothetical protein
MFSVTKMARGEQSPFSRESLCQLFAVSKLKKFTFEDENFFGNIVAVVVIEQNSIYESLCQPPSQQII